MPRHVTYQTTNLAIEKTAREFIFAKHTNIYTGLYEQLSGLNSQSETAIQIIVGILLTARIEQKELAEAVGVSRTTINRWANGDNIPRSPSYREFLMTKLLSLLKTKSSACDDNITLLNKTKVKPSAASTAEVPERPQPPTKKGRSLTLVRD